MKRFLIFLSIVGFLMFAKSSVFACQCSVWILDDSVEKVQNISEEDVKSVRNFYLNEFEGAIFFGKVMKIKKKWIEKEYGGKVLMNRISIKVEKSWVGVEKSTIEIYTNLGKGGDCGVRYKKGKSYFFNPYQSRYDSLFYINGCHYLGASQDYWIAYFTKILGEGKNFNEENLNSK